MKGDDYKFTAFDWFTIAGITFSFLYISTGFVLFVA